MSTEPAKKKHKADDCDDAHEDEGAASMAEVGGTTMGAILAEMKSHMSRMQNEMDGMKSRLSHMDELERKCQIQEENMDKLESNCKFLKAECGSLERSMQILIKEQKWEYSAPSIPTFHWINNGFEEQYIEGMEYLLKQLKDNTIKLRNGRCADHFPHNTQNICLSGGFDDVNDHTILLHDDLLLPHWKEFAIALQLYHNSSRLLNFYLRNVELTSSVMDLLASALKRKAIFKYVVLDGNDFVNTHDGIEFAVKLIGYNPKLEQFEWVNNQIESMEDARYLVDAIISHPGIVDIRIEHCFGGDINGYEILRSLLRV